MGFTKKIDARTLSLVLIAFIGGVVGGYVSNATMNNTQIEGLSNALTTQLISKDTQIATLSSKVTTLQDQLSRLEESVSIIEDVPIIGVNTPDFDSGWIAIEEDADGIIWVRHDLGTLNLFVYLLGSETYVSGGEIVTRVHQIAIGRDIYDDDNNDRGVWWIAGEQYINIERSTDDNFWNRNFWNEVRVLIWVLPDPPEATATP